MRSGDFLRFQNEDKLRINGGNQNMTLSNL